MTSSNLDIIISTDEVVLTKQRKSLHFCVTLQKWRLKNKHTYIHTYMYELLDMLKEIV